MLLSIFSRSLGAFQAGFFFSSCCIDVCESPLKKRERKLRFYVLKFCNPFYFDATRARLFENPLFRGQNLYITESARGGGLVNATPYRRCIVPASVQKFV